MKLADLVGMYQDRLARVLRVDVKDLPYVHSTRFKEKTTKHAFLQHVNRAAYQAGHVWGQAHLAVPNPVDITKWGWTESGSSLRPFWSTQPDVWEKCQLRKKCHCKKICKASRCPCMIAGIPCKYECRYKGTCQQPPKM